MVTKKKVVQAPAKKRAVALRPSVKKKQGQEEEQSPKPAEVWASEIQALTAHRFASMDQAIEALVERVVTRLGGDHPFADDERLALQLALETDPIIRATLARSLKVG